MARDEMELLDGLEKSIQHFDAMRRHRFWMGVAVVVMALVTMTFMAVTSYQQRQCDEALEAHMVKRAQWADEDREALQTLISSVFEDDADPVQYQAYQDWLRTTKQNVQARNRVGLPDLAADC